MSQRSSPSGGTRGGLRPAGFDARPHRPSSLRAQAQRVFRKVAEREGLEGRSTPTPNPPSRDALRRASPPDAIGRASSPQYADAQTTSLTQQARALYEASVVPVAEIARLAGVSERTLYKYVSSGGWRRRRAGQDIAAAVSKREARREASPPRPCVTAKGAGGRFIRSADVDVPVRRGLKALDSEGEVLALAACAQAEALSDAAVARTERLRASIAETRLLSEMVRLLRQGMPAERRGKGRARRKPWRPMLVSPLRVAEAPPEPPLSEADRRINAVATGFYEKARDDE